MTTDEIAVINGKLDEQIMATSGVMIELAKLTVEFKAHRELEQFASENRKATCPQLQLLHKLVTDMDAIAGKQREAERTTAFLSSWHKGFAEAEAVEHAERRIALAPIKWLGKNAEKVMLALVIAWMMFRFGF